MAKPNRRSDGRRLRLIGKEAARLAGSGGARSVRAFWQRRNVRSGLQRLSEQTLPGLLVWNAQGDSQTQAAPEVALFAGDMRLVAYLGSFAVLACVGMPGRPFKLLVTQVLSRRTAKLVAATARRSPSELQRHHEKKQVNKEATHRFSVASAVGFATPRMQRSVAGCGLRNRRCAPCVRGQGARRPTTPPSSTDSGGRPTRSEETPSDRSRERPFSNGYTGSVSRRGKQLRRPPELEFEAQRLHPHGLDRFAMASEISPAQAFRT